MRVEDLATKLLRDLTKVLQANHPRRLTICLAAGIVLQGISSIGYSAFPNTAALKSASEQWLLFYIALAVFVGFLRIKPDEAPEGVQQQLRLIEEYIARGKLSQTETRQVWRTVLQKSINNFQPELSKEEIAKAAEDAKGSQVQ